MSRIREIINEIEKAAPKFLKEDYDNVGMMVGDEETEVKKVLIALDCTKEVIEEASSLGCGMIITHHPLFFRKPNSIVKGDLTGDKVLKLIKEDINLYSCHTNLDSAENGINEAIVKLLGFNESTIIEKSKVKNFENVGIGRIVTLDNELSALDIISLVKDKLNISDLRAATSDRKIKKIAVINGSGQDFFEEAKNLGADCIITGDTTYHFVSDYNEMGITIIDAGHFNTENIIFLNIMKSILAKFVDIEVIQSETSEDVYKFF